MARIPHKLKFLAGIAGFLLAWLWIRFPFEMRNATEHLLGISREVNPVRLHLSGEFVESNLGTSVDPGGSVTVRLIAQQYDFVPRCMLVPAGTSIHFRITSADAVHRFAIDGTGEQVEVVPGHVSEMRARFENPGEYRTPCHEFCGIGHYSMLSRVVALDRDKFPKLRPDQRVNCATP
jgi:cytochrome c oxidase subunit II